MNIFGENKREKKKKRKLSNYKSNIFEQVVPYSTSTVVEDEIQGLK